MGTLTKRFLPIDGLSPGTGLTRRKRTNGHESEHDRTRCTSANVGRKTIVTKASAARI